MVVCVDATKVPTRASENVDDSDNKSYECQYRDSKVATVSAVQRTGADEHAPEQKAEDEEDDQQVRLTKTTCVTGIEHADEFFPRIEVEMQRRSAHLATLVLVVIADGASWIWERLADLAENGQKVWHILDFWHACEHLATIGRLLYGDGSDRLGYCQVLWMRPKSSPKRGDGARKASGPNCGAGFRRHREDVRLRAAEEMRIVDSSKKTQGRRPRHGKVGSQSVRTESSC